MNKSLIIFFMIVFISGCAVTSEKYRYQGRIDNYYKLLNNDEKDAFRNGDYDQLAASFSKRIEADKKLSNEFIKVQQYEAITTFDAKQTAHFFREIILKELNRNNFYSFMNFFNEKSQLDFARNSNFSEDFNNLYNNNREFKKFIDNLKTEYRLNGYSNDQIIKFFRNISFPEVSRRELYHVFEILKDFQGVNEFTNGNVILAAQKVDSGVTKLVTADMAFNELKKRTSLTRLNTSELLDVYYNVILKEMDPYAVARTLMKF